MILVKEIPPLNNISPGDIFEIETNNGGYFTHSFFKYPAKFIPQIPRWAIKTFTKEYDSVLDCFAGSGTTLVEASLQNRIPFGIDFDKISNLLSNVKTTKLSDYEIERIKVNMQKFDFLSFLNEELPSLKNLDYWFSNENITSLNHIFFFIETLNENEKIKNFFRVCFISIIRKSSFSDEVSPKPYISSRIKKEPQNPIIIFKKTINNYLSELQKDEFKLNRSAIFIGDDARRANNKKYFGKMHLVCASPPYINAFDYVRILRLENIWLRNLNDNNIVFQKEKQIGTEQVSSKLYNQSPGKIGIEELDAKISELYLLDKKRAYIVKKYFDDMTLNIINMKKYLVEGGHYILVVGDSNIKGIEFPSYRYLIKIAENHGYNYNMFFSYLIKNPYLRIPRKNKGGLIKFDRVIILRNEKNGTK